MDSNLKVTGGEEVGPSAGSPLRGPSGLNQENLCAPCTYSPEVEADYTLISSSVIPPSPPLSGTLGGPNGSEGNSQEWPSWRRTLGPSAIPLGLALWIASRRESLAQLGLRPAVEWAPLRTILKPSCERSMPAGLNGSSSSALPTTSGSMGASDPFSGMLDIPLPVRSSWTLPHWVRHILESDIGLLATPTRTANQDCPSMQKWPSCRRLTRVLGRVTPEGYSWLMDWPLDALSSKPSEMVKSPSKPRQRGSSSAVRKSATEAVRGLPEPKAKGSNP